MADAKVVYFAADKKTHVSLKDAVYFAFNCPVRGYPCQWIPIAGRVSAKRDGQNKNGGLAQWDIVEGSTDAAPTFKPSINCGGCWHGFIENGRTVNCQKKDEPEPKGSN